MGLRSDLDDHTNTEDYVPKDDRVFAAYSVCEWCGDDGTQ